MPRIPRVVRLLKNNGFETTAESLSRRVFLSQSSRLALSGGLASLLGCREKRPTQTTPRIAIIGAGIAGLTAAHYLEKAGLTATLYDAQSRVGGRIVSAQGLLADGITTEMGGEFIDSNHDDVRYFCRLFNLPLLDTKAGSEARLVSTDYYFGGRRITEAEIREAFRPFSARVRADIASFPESLDPNHPAVRSLDRLSIDAYLERIGMSGWLSEVIRGSFTSELGLESEEQSSLNLLVMLNPDVSKQVELYGDSDERYKVIGGNERIVTELSRSLSSPVQLGWQLERLRARATDYELAFTNGQTQTADFVLLTVPFSVLRTVRLDVELPERKRRCIAGLGYGMQSKLFLGVNERIWREQGYTGYVLSDHVHNGWDSSQMQHNNAGPGGYSLFLGGEKGRTLALSQADVYLKGVNSVFPGVAATYNGRKNLYNWNQNMFARGAYACYKVGQVSDFGGSEGQRVGNLFFAGEHCSVEFQGFMNGGAETGRRAAEDIVRMMQTRKFSPSTQQP